MGYYLNQILNSIEFYSKKLEFDMACFRVTLWKSLEIFLLKSMRNLPHFAKSSEHLCTPSRVECGIITHRVVVITGIGRSVHLQDSFLYIRPEPKANLQSS